jgi:hypothetical protein
MCCFTGPVNTVTRTRIFARREGREQALVYSMVVSADQPVAMVLPIPVVPGSGDDALRFVSLERYPALFTDIAAGFPEERMRSAPAGSAAGTRSAPPPPLVVHEVGAFEASYVPSVADFARLDPRFRLPRAVTLKVPEYHDYGFAVFKLAAGLNKEIHPMAFWFPTRLVEHDELFFPTIHVHDGTLATRADFSHTFYFQPTWTGSDLVLRETNGTVEEYFSGGNSTAPRGFHGRSSTGLAKDFVDVARANGLVSPDRPFVVSGAWGRRRNTDMVIGAPRPGVAIGR